VGVGHAGEISDWFLLIARPLVGFDLTHITRPECPILRAICEGGKHNSQPCRCVLTLAKNGRSENEVNKNVSTEDHSCLAVHSSWTIACCPWFGWAMHKFRGNGIQSSGVFFGVPDRYFEKTSSDGRSSMWRCDFGVPLWHATYGFIGIYPHHDGRKFDLQHDLEGLRTILINQEKLAGMNLNAQRKLDTKIGTAVCFQFKSEKRSNVSCFFNNSTMSILYEGSEKFVGDSMNW
jgi:hypothetical protein